MSSWLRATEDQATDLTGAQHFMDGSDIRSVLEECGVELSGRVVEFGCGTGRLAQLCEEYVGYDVSPAFVEVARKRGVDAHLGIPESEHGDWLFIVHVLCHIPREERLDLLSRDVAPRLLTDIIPGFGGLFGEPLIYTVEFAEMEEDLAATGWKIVAKAHRGAHEDSRFAHSYYVCER